MGSGKCQVQSSKCSLRRLALLRTVRVSTCGSYRRCKDLCQCSCFVDQLGVVLDATVPEVLEPVQAFVGFLGDGAKFGLELGAGASLPAPHDSSSAPSSPRVAIVQQPPVLPRRSASLDRMSGSIEQTAACARPDHEGACGTARCMNRRHDNFGPKPRGAAHPVAHSALTSHLDFALSTY